MGRPSARRVPARLRHQGPGPAEPLPAGRPRRGAGRAPGAARGYRAVPVQPRAAPLEGPGDGLPAAGPRPGGTGHGAAPGEARALLDGQPRARSWWRGARCPSSSSRARRSPTRWTTRRSGTPRSGAFLRGSFLEGGGALYTLTPYRPGRVPVVLVHGTASSPARWADLVNELEADPRIAAAHPALVLHLQHGPPHPVFRRSPPRDARRRPWPSWTRRRRTRRCVTWS